MATPAFRIDVPIHDLLTKSRRARPQAPASTGPALPTPVFPRYRERLEDPGPETAPDRRTRDLQGIYRLVRGWLVPYLRSRVLPGDFHPITAYLFVEYKCNLDCWYCWSYNNKVKGMTEAIARRSIDWLHDRGCRVVGLMGGEPLLRPAFAHKVVDYAARKGFWTYIGTNGRLLTPDLADRLGDAGVGVFNFALDAWNVKPGLPKALVPVRKNIEHLLRKQYVYDYMVFLNINICRNNLEDVRQLTEFAHEHRIATDYHINETPMLEQDGHFRHLSDNPTYIRPDDRPEVDALLDWLIEKNKAGYQMVNSVRRLQEMKTFVRMAAGVDLKTCGWNGDGTGAVGPDITPGVAQDEQGRLHFAEWGCRAGQNNVIIRTDGTVAPCFPLYDATFDWGDIDGPKFDRKQLADLKKSCQRHCFSTLNHNLAYCYNDSRVIKWLWRQALNGFQGGRPQPGGLKPFVGLFAAAARGFNPVVQSCMQAGAPRFDTTRGHDAPLSGRPRGTGGGTIRLAVAAEDRRHLQRCTGHERRDSAGGVAPSPLRPGYRSPTSVQSSVACRPPSLSCQPVRGKARDRQGRLDPDVQKGTSVSRWNSVA